MHSLSVAQIQQHVFECILATLPPHLTYHNLRHTRDVVQAALAIAEAERVTAAEKTWLHVAALYHDTGFLKTYAGHEEVSCEMARHDLPGFGLEPADIDAVCQLIMATRVPQQPASKLEQILCDADLDYLGRDDFFEIGNLLFLELQFLGMVTSVDDWNRKQVAFLERHRYFTATATALREAQKRTYLNLIRQRLR